MKKILGYIEASDGEEYPIFWMSPEEVIERNEYLKCYGGFCGDPSQGIKAIYINWKGKDSEVYQSEMGKLVCKMKVCKFLRTPSSYYHYLCLRCASYMAK